MAEPIFLPLIQPLDLPSTLASGQCFRWWRDGEGAWVGVLGCDVVRLRMTAEGLAIESAPTPPAEMAERIVDYLRLDDDLPALQRRLGVDEYVAQGIAHYPGLRLLRQDPWETLAGFILSSTSNIPRISRTMELIAATYGEPVVLEGAAGVVPGRGEGAQAVRPYRSVSGDGFGGDRVTRHTFPAPGVLAEAGEQAMRNLGCGFRAPYLVRAAQAVGSGELPLYGLRGAPYADALAALTSLHGVGDKIADCVMLFSLDRLEAFPADRWVRRAVEDWYGMERTLSYEGVRRWAWERFGADAGYANQVLFWDRRQGRGRGTITGT